MIRSHTDHRSIKAPEKEQIVGQISRRLKGHADHDARTGLITDCLEIIQRLQPPFITVQPILWMDLPVQVGIGGFDAQQIAMGSGIEPFGIHIARLLAQG